MMPSRNPSQTRSGTNQTRPSSPVFITGIGLCCQTGTEAFALFGAVGTQLAGTRTHDCLDAPLPGKKDRAPILFVPVSGLEGLDMPHDRIAVLAQNALTKAVEQLSETISGEKILVLTLIPSAETPRGKNLDLADLKETLTSSHPRLNSACFRFLTVDRGCVDSLQETCIELQQGKWQAILFGGADSLVDMVTCSELVYRREAMPKGGVEGVIPGEGAAYLVMENHPSQTCWGQINAMYTAPEPHHGQAHDQRMTGMIAAIKAALQDTGISPDKVDGIVLPYGNRMTEALEWHQVVEAVWPRQENVSRKFEVLRPGISLGETGAAALPLGLALGCARFEFEFPTADNLLVCTSHPATTRGAVSLTRVKQSPGSEKQ